MAPECLGLLLLLGIQPPFNGFSPGAYPAALMAGFHPVLACNKSYKSWFFVLDLSQIQGGRMLNEMILTTTLCLTIVGAMALFYGEMKLLKNSH